MSSAAASASNRSNREERRRRSRTPPSPLKDRSQTTSSKLSHRSSKLTPSASTTLTDTDTTSFFEDVNPNPNYIPRSFPHSVKQQCWEKAHKIKGRDPDRWRKDPLGNIVFRKLVGCPGCLCHDYDHILPYSKLCFDGGKRKRRQGKTMRDFNGGESTMENCQVLQATVNRSKGNRTDMSKAELIQKSCYCKVSDRDMDLLEISAYGNVRRGQDSGGCRIQ